MFNNTLFVIGILLFIFFAYSVIISFNEKEQRAAIKLLFVFFMIIPIFILPSILNLDELYSKVLLTIFIIIILFLIVPVKGKIHKKQIHQNQIDERDIMFSREELIPETEKYSEYYTRKPDKLKLDNKFRKNLGLLKPGTTKYNAILFAISDANFFTVESFKNRVDGVVSKNKQNVEAKEISKFIKKHTIYAGAKACGITELKKSHLYSIKGRGNTYGKTVENNHRFAIAITVEMKKEMVDTAPFAPTVTESSRQYIEAGKLAIQLASFIRNMGYSAKAHIDGNYDVVCPLVAKDAGLGELGRMGLLISPKEGPRVRISVVTTDLELIPDKVYNSNSVIDFCIKCKKCATNCPSQAISFFDREEINGVIRWQINQEACYTYWTKAGTDCSKCMQVCPYSHQNNFLHNLVRKGIDNSSIFRKFALLGDDFLYGKKPKAKPFPKFMDINNNKNFI